MKKNNSCISRLCDNDRRSFARLYQYQTNNFSAQRSNFHSAGVAKTESPESPESSESAESSESGESGESGESTDSSDSMFQNSCVSRLFGTVRCNFVRLLKHNCARLCNFQLNFHSTFSSGRFKSISRAKHGVRSRRDLNLTQF